MPPPPLSTLQDENAQLRESRDHWKRLAHELSEGVNGKDAEHERLQAENEKLRTDVVRLNDLLASYQNVLVPELRAELERVKAERDAAVEDVAAIIGDVEEIRRGYGVDNEDADGAFARLCETYCANNGCLCYAECEKYHCKNFKWRGQKED